MNIHIGICMTIGKGSHIQLYVKNLNMKSSTDAELVAVNDSMVQALWTRQFLTAQENIALKQPHTKTTVPIVLANIGKTSSSQRAQHLNVWVFFHN